MKVYIVGAIAEPGGTDRQAFEDERQRFEGACRAIGAALVRAEHVVHVDIPSWERLRNGTVAAPYIIQGIKEEKVHSKPFQVVLYQPTQLEPKDENTPAVDTIAEILAPVPGKPFNLQIEPRVYSSELEFFGNMRRADAFILIGGGPGTALTGQSAAYLRKPIVALKSFGGAAQQSFDLVLSSIYRELGVSERDKVALTRPWSADPEQNRDNADAVVRFTDELHTALVRAVAPEERMRRIFLLLMPLALAGWVGLLILVPQLISAVAYVLMLVLASVLGTGLRLLLAAQSSNAPAFTLTFVWSQVTLSLLVAFGLMLVYLIGGISFTGNIVDLTGYGNAAVSIGLSVIGFAAGYLLPVARLRSGLTELIAPTKPKE
jgi:hypothetical protein